MRKVFKGGNLADWGLAFVGLLGLGKAVGLSSILDLVMAFLRSEFEEIDAFNLIWTMDCEHMCQNIIVLHQIRERKGKRTEDTQVHTCILRLAI